jgi:hypothetical protein
MKAESQIGCESPDELGIPFRRGATELVVEVCNRERQAKITCKFV